MSSVNRCILVGALGRDPELQHTPSGVAVCKMSLATSYKHKDGKEKTTWHRVVAWDKQAENCAKYLAKGRSIYVEGRIDNREYTDKAGVKKHMSEVIAENVVFLPGGRDKPAASPASPPAAPPQQERAPGDDDDMPF